MTKHNAVWFITGASRGFGLVLAQHALARGYRVAATSRTVDALTASMGAASDRFLPLAMEVTREASVAAAVATTLQTFGSLDVVVNNAGYGQLGTIEETSDAEARRNFDVNVFGALNVLRAALPTLRAQRRGHVFNISSIGGFVGGFSGWGIYCASKFALAGLTEAVHADLAAFDITTTLVYPGYFRTDFLSPASVAQPARPIAAYAAARDSQRRHTDEIAGQQPGDPAKAVDVLIDVYERGNAPLHLFLGSDALELAEGKLGEVARALADHAAISRSTDF
jgi:NAD(P)-dependent dehydrogenase (short-subunit alcohol dehydrogenase family)